jgi:hypothetical protein
MANRRHLLIPGAAYIEIKYLTFYTLQLKWMMIVVINKKGGGTFLSRIFLVWSLKKHSILPYTFFC